MRTKLLFTLLFFNITLCFSQRHCATVEYQNEVIKKNPNIKGRSSRYSSPENYKALLKSYDQEITIPVVVHVVYKTDEQNIPDARIAEQLAVLNNDLRGTNSDITKVPKDFMPVLAKDCKIRFELAKTTRTKTEMDVFYVSADNIKRTVKGGKDAGIYASGKYLNIWVGNISDGSEYTLLGYATMPGYATAALDGVVINYKAFGFSNLLQNFNKGRTATHEVGHWLGLDHIWGGDFASCDDDDGIGDTPIQKQANGGCPGYPKATQCKSQDAPFGDMFMNYLDYVDDECMYMFTAGQKDRMRASFLPGGPRSGIILNSGNLQKVDTSVRMNYEEQFTAVFDNNLLKLEKINGVTAYEVHVKPIDGEKAEIYTDIKSSIKGLDPEKLYEIEIKAKTKDAILESTPLLIQPTSTEIKIN